MKVRLTKITAILAVVVMLFSAMTVVSVDSLFSDADDNTTPSAYTVDSDYLTPVRNQGSEGLCWAFGVTSTLESELILNGYYDNTTILSPLFTGVKQFDGYEKDYESGDYNALVKEGTKNVTGGTGVQLIEMLSNGKCPIEEYLAPYDEFKPDYDGADTTLPSLVLVKGIEAYNPYTDADEIKSMLCQDKTAIFFYNAGQNFLQTVDYNYGTYVTVNVAATEGLQSNHAVSLVGYDDNFPKENFAIQPKNDGAWLIKNSWGVNSQGAGDCGYYYVSYESVITQILFITELEMNDGTQHIYSYDNGYSTNSNIYRTGEATMANVFTAERDETITGASFSVIDCDTILYLTSLNQNYTVSVYELKDKYSNPYDGECVYTSDKGLVTHCGTTYVEFDDDLDVSKGDKFSICVTFTGDSIVLPVDTKEAASSTAVYHIESEAGQSYTYSNGKWIDISADGKSNFRIKAYTSANDGDVASVNGTTYSTIQGAVDNAKSGDTVYLLKSTNISKAIEITGKDITLDLRGYQLANTSGAAIKIKDSSATVQYGRIISPVCVETDNSKVDVKRCYLQPSINCVNVTNKSSVNLDKVKIDTYKDDTGVTVDNSALTFIDCYQSDDNESYVIVTTSNNGSATFNGGTYYGDVSGDNIKATSGIFKNFIPEVSEGSIINGEQVSIPTIEYVENGTGITKKTGSLTQACLNSSSARLIADVNTSESICTYKDGQEFTLDLNGHNLTTSSALIAAYDLMNPDSYRFKSITITNSQQDRSTVTCRSLGLMMHTITIGERIDIKMTSDIASGYYSNIPVVLNIADGSTASYTSDTGSSVSTSIPYSSDGKLCATVTTHYKDSNGNVTAVEKESRIFTTFDMLSKYTFTAEKTYTDGTVEKTYGNGTLYNGTPYTYAKTIEKDDTVSYKEEYYDTDSGSTRNVDAVKGGRCEITKSITANMNTTAIEKANVEAAIKELNEIKNSDTIKNLGCTTIVMYVSINSFSGSERVITPEISKMLIDGGVGIKVTSYSTVSVPLSTIKEIGERTISVYLSELSSDDVNKEQEKTISGYRIVRNLNIVVDGNDYTKKLENPIEMSIFVPNSSADSKVYHVNENGTLTEIECEYVVTGNSDMLKFNATSAGVYVFDVEPSSGEQKDDTALIIVVVAIVAIVVAIAASVLIKRRKH